MAEEEKQQENQENKENLDESINKDDGNANVNQSNFYLNNFLSIFHL